MSVNKYCPYKSGFSELWARLFEKLLYSVVWIMEQAYHKPGLYRGPGQPSPGLQRSTCCYSWTKTASATMWFRSQQHRSKRRPHAQGAVFEQTQLSEFPLSAHVCNVVKFCRFMAMSAKVSFIKNVYILEIIASLHSVREMLLCFFPSTYTSGGYEVSCLEMSYFLNLHVVVCVVRFDIVRACPGRFILAK